MVYLNTNMNTLVCYSRLSILIQIELFTSIRIVYRCRDVQHFQNGANNAPGRGDHIWNNEFSQPNLRTRFGRKNKRQLLGEWPIGTCSVRVLQKKRFEWAITKIILWYLTVYIQKRFCFTRRNKFQNFTFYKRCHAHVKFIILHIHYRDSYILTKIELS